jgi:fatty acid desaturase
MADVHEAPSTQKKKRHVFRWVFLAIQALFLIWIIAGASSAGDNCAGKTGDALDACQAGTAVGAGIGITLIIFLWVAVDVILGITYLIFRRRS